ncbi:Tat pathway signal protein [Streptomyces sp. NBC_01530]|uniref:Tat pathway signal protein n=1 Tax=Streptomyces sp. NBC_01530 TaxID=2903895 RepID=UPI00386B9892
MSDADSCPRARRRRAAAFFAAVALLSSLLGLSGAGSAAAADASVAAEGECATLAVAPFGDPGDAVGRATVAPGASACYTVTAEAPGLYLVPLQDSSNEAYRQVLAADGSQVDCNGDEYATNGMCTLPSAGTYTVKVVNDGWADAETAVTVVPLGGTKGCADPAGTNWDQPDGSRTAVGPVQVDCLPFDAKRGERIRLTYGSKVYGNSLAWITDATGARVCPHFPEDGEDSCVLPGDGPFRVISRVSYTEKGFPAEYGVKVRRLNDPQGCTAAPVRPYGVPAQQDLTMNPCYTFTVGRAGPYTVHHVSEQRSAGPVQVYDANGLTVCRSGDDPCRMAKAGTYTAVLDGSYPFQDFREGLVVFDRASDSGCAAVGTGLYKGELSAVGQYDCLSLSAPQGARIAALTPLVSSGVDADVEVLDRDGTAQCDATALSNGDCALTGPAPYRALVHTEDNGDDATGAYSVAFHRTDAANDCPVLPAGSFTADGAEATLATGDGVFSHCLSIPADAHTGAEVFQLLATSGGVPAKFSVLDSTGRKVCDRNATTDGWTVCALTPGKAHTVLVTGQDKAATYTLARRDVTATADSAGCMRTTAVKVGGPSVKGGYGAPGTLNCHQVTTDAATDVVHLDVRDALGTANIAVMGGDGKPECSFRNRSCAATGSTTHQVLVQTPATLKAAPEYHLDALRVATADGPAPECTRVPSVAYGYGPITGTLDESHTAVCAVLPTAGFDRFDTAITDTTGAATTAVPVLYNSAWNNGCTLYIPTGYQCAAGGSSSGAAQSVFLLGLPEKASRTSYSAKLSCTSPLCGTDKVSVTGASPDTGVSGSKVRLTVTGTALGPDDTVRLSLSGRTLTAATDSLSTDNRTLTATVDLTGAAAGTWNVSVIAHNAEYQRGTFTVTQAQLTNTAAPKATGTAKVGAKVTAAAGSWSAAPSSYTYQWKADGKAISGATASTYTIPAAQLGKKLGVTVTAVKSGWLSGTATSAGVTVAKGDAPRATKVPVISGTVKVGRTLKSTAGTWSPTATSYAYQWYANGKAISGATKSSLVLKPAQKGKRITVKVVAHRTGHQDGSAVSKASSAVAG